MKILNMQNTKKVNEVAALKYEGKAVPHPYQMQKPSVWSTWEGQRYGLNARVSWHHHLHQQDPSSASK